MSQAKNPTNTKLASRELLLTIGTDKDRNRSRKRHDASKKNAASLPGRPKNMPKFETQSLKSLNDESNNMKSNEFELMHIKITLLGLSGVLIENHVAADSSIRTSPLNKKKFNLRRRRTITIPSAEESVQSSFTRVDENIKDNNNSFYAVISHNRNFSGHSVSIESHLPSMPFEHAAKLVGVPSRYNAEWPANNVTPLLDEKSTNILLDGSSFSMQRSMRRESFNYQKTASSKNVNNFIHETLDLRIQLKHGSEMIPLGIASFVVTGEEDCPVKMNIPAKPIKIRKNKMVQVEGKNIPLQTMPNGGVGKSRKRRLREQRKLNKKIGELPTFSIAKGTTGTLDENASLRISVQAIPLASLKEAEKAKERHIFQEQRKKERFQRQQDHARRMKEKSDLENQAARANVVPAVERRQKSGILAGISEIFCHSVGILDAETMEERFRELPGEKEKLKSPEKDLSQEENYLGQRGISFESSVLSSVSESELESESEDEEEVHLNRTILLEKRLYES
mmetsp:Transcript_4286/g.6687  ORF Transcript_4286/g.6687 Transcript_4286/m.6687 type:complete len:510 (+) Transcript_4286:79-1608(+)